MFWVVLRVIGSKVGRKVKVSRFWAETHYGLNPWDFFQKFKFTKTCCRGKKSPEMMFGLVLRVIGSKVEAKLKIAVFGQKPWTNPL